MMKVKVLRDIEEIQRLEPDWQRLQTASHGAVFSSHLWSMVWLRRFGDVASPLIATIWQGDELKGIAPFVSYRGSFRGYPLRYLCMVGNVGETTEFHDLGLLYDEDGPEMIEAFVESVRSVPWNMLQLRDLRWDRFATSFYEALRRRWPCEEMVSKPCPRATLDPARDPIEQFEARTARKVRRILNQLDDEGRLGHRISRTIDQVSSAMDTYIEHHKLRWASKGGSIYADPVQAAFLKDISVACARRKDAVIYEVMIDGKVASQQLCIREGQVMHMYKIGMDDQFRAYAPGYLSLYFAMNEARKEGYSEFDLGPGPEDYKYKVGGKDRFTHNIQGKRGSVALLSKASRMPGIRRLREGALQPAPEPQDRSGGADGAAGPAEGPRPGH